jgi:hypothetical protein
MVHQPDDPDTEPDAVRIGQLVCEDGHDPVGWLGSWKERWGYGNGEIRGTSEPPCWFCGSPGRHGYI